MIKEGMVIMLSVTLTT